MRSTTTVIGLLAIFVWQSRTLAEDVNVDDSSPLITYTPLSGWKQKTGETNYWLYNDTDTLGVQKDAKATFKFAGTVCKPIQSYTFHLTAAGTWWRYVSLSGTY